MNMSTEERPIRTTSASSATSSSPDEALAPRIWIPRFQEHSLREHWGASRSSINERKPRVLSKPTPVKSQMLRDFAGALCFSLCSTYTVIAEFHVDQWNCLCSGSSIALPLSRREHQASGRSSHAPEITVLLALGFASGLATSCEHQEVWTPTSQESAHQQLNECP